MNTALSTLPDEATVWSWLEAVCDPEIPVVNLREMGIVREVQVLPEVIRVVITPTYSGCPAMGQMQDDVQAVLRAQGVPCEVVVSLSPAWTTDWMTDAAREKLRAYGIAPPVRCQHPQPGLGREAVLRFVREAAASVAVPCPRCGSVHTVETSAFGSTACKSLHRCLDCREPFDHFKAI